MWVMLHNQRPNDWTEHVFKCWICSKKAGDFFSNWYSARGRSSALTGWNEWRESLVYFCLIVFRLSHQTFVFCHYHMCCSCLVLVFNPINNSILENIHFGFQSGCFGRKTSVVIHLAGEWTLCEVCDKLFSPQLLSCCCIRLWFVPCSFRCLLF